MNTNKLPNEVNLLETWTYGRVPLYGEAGDSIGYVEADHKGYAVARDEKGDEIAGEYSLTRFEDGMQIQW